MTVTSVPIEANQLIDGRWVEAVGNERLSVVDPSTGSTIGSVPSSDTRDVDIAVAAARRAFEGWGRTTPRERSEALLRIARDVELRAAELARLESLNVGKPPATASEEVSAVVDNLRFFAGAARVIEGKAAAEYVQGRTSWIRRDPLGVVAGIAPWNYPLFMAGWKFGPAVVAGNAIVLKPSARTPFSTLVFADIASAHLPPGVVNVVTGTGPVVGEALSSHPDVDMVSLTGDTATGRRIAAIASATVKRLQLELGGKAPFVVFDDADIDLAIQTVRMAGYSNAGQDCTAAARVLVHRSRVEEFVSKLTDSVRSIKTGGPLDLPQAEMGPLISKEQQKRVAGFVDRARRDADVAVGGKVVDREGFFYEPTLVLNPPQGAEIVQEEVFGPVVTVQVFDGDDEAFRWANGVRYGLAASVWTQDLRRALRATRELKVGTVWINEHFLVISEMPHGGVRQSGYGKDQSTYSVEEYTAIKHVMSRI